MSVLNLSAVMVDLAAAVQTVLDTNRMAYDHPVEGIVPGDAIVAYPQDPIDIGTTFRRGQDSVVVPVFVICGLPQDEATRDAVSAWIGSGSIVAAIQSYAGTWSDVAVRTARIEEFSPVGGSPLVALRFDVDVIS